MSLRRVCVFCGSSTGFNEEYKVAATHLADELVARHIGVVFGGGKVGLMGVVADSVLARGGEAIGVIPQALALREVAHDGLADLAGTVLGVAGAIGVGHLLRTLLYGFAPMDTWTLAAVCAVLGTVAVVAVVDPAWRAARVSPRRALEAD